MKVVYLGIDILKDALKALLAEGCEVSEVFTCPTDNRTEWNTGVITLAKKAGIPYRLSPITSEDLDRLAGEGCTHLLSAGYYYRIPVKDGWKMANIHPAPLPEYRGGWPMPILLLRGEKRGGVALHRVSPGFDEGDIIAQDSFPIGPRLTLAGYMRKVSALLPRTVHTLLSFWENGDITPKKQEGGHYYPMPTEEDYTVTPTMTVEEADLILRAFYGYECYYRAEGHLYELIGARAQSKLSEGKITLQDGGGIFPLRDGAVFCRRVREC